MFAVNVVFTQRILRAVHPKFGWHPVVSNAFLVIIISVPVVIINNIVFITIFFFTQNKNVGKVAHGFLLLGAVWTMLLSVFPILVIVIATTIPRAPGEKVEKFGSGRLRSKIIILVFASAILFAGAIARIASDIQGRPADAPGKVNSTAVFYTTGFMLEIIVVIGYAVGRVDLRFWIPNGSSGPGDYSKKETDQEELFPDVDVKKMRMSIQSTIATANWEEDASEKPALTWEEIRDRIDNLGLKSEVVGRPLDIGDSELLLYAFRVKKFDGGVTVLPQRPP